MKLTPEARNTISIDSGGPFVISFFFFVKIDLVPDSASKYHKDTKKIGCHFFILRLTDKISEKQNGRHMAKVHL